MHRRAFLTTVAGGAAWALLDPRAPLRAAPPGDPDRPLPAGTGQSTPPSSPAGDLRLPVWGPYSKHLAGISHLPDLASGLRFDLCVFPGLYRRRQVVPLVTSDSGFYPWSANPGLASYTFRHALLDLDTCYVDVSYQVEEEGAIIRARFVNDTPLPQQAALHFLAALRFPEGGPNRRPSVRPAEVALPAGAVWLDGPRYAELSLDDEAVQRHLPDQAEIWGEIRGDGFVHGLGLGRGFGGQPSDRVAYAVPPGFAVSGTVALLRYRLERGQRLTLRAAGAYGGTQVLEGSGDFQLAAFPAADPAASVLRFAPAAGSARMEINGCALVAAARQGSVGFSLPPLDSRPRIGRHGDGALHLHFAPVAGQYGLAWEGPGKVREWLSDDIERDFAFFTHEHVRQVFELGGAQHFTNVSVQPIFLGPGESRELGAVVAYGGTDAEVARHLASLPRRRRAAGQVAGAAPAPDTVPAHTEAGRAYAFGIERMAATVATNVVYPIRRRGRFIRHYTPGRWWDSLYTWDSGFIGLGLLELSVDRAIDNLAAYLTAPDDDCAFIHHGSPLPVQIYQLQALWNRTQDRALLARFFPGARRMHRFLVGRGEGSRTANLRSGLLRTWDYFYNSGGWDDYPPQAFLRGTPLVDSVAPVVNTAHAIRTARILAVMAAQLGEPDAEFATDVARLGAALQTHAWNSQSGWFSYTRHGPNGEALGPLLHESGTDFNRGLDGIYPLVAGVCTPEQEQLFVDRLQDARVFWTRCGLSTVDQSAPYFRTDGYWNGAVWMPHQWFFWKTLLDLGRGDFAAQLALTALATWEREVRATGCCFEHFIVATGRGAGWHHFGGLSSPVLSWFAAYFRPGTVTGGFDCWTMAQSYDGRSLRARLRLTGAAPARPSVLAVVPGQTPAAVRWKGAPVAAIARHPGTLEITLPSGADEGELTIG